MAPFIFASSKPVYVHSVPTMGSMKLESDTVRSTNQSIPPGGRGQEAGRGASVLHLKGSVLSDFIQGWSNQLPSSKLTSSSPVTSSLLHAVVV